MSILGKQQPKTARRIKNISAQFEGVAFLYELSESVTFNNGKKDINTFHVVASATVIPMSGAETYIFPADEHGNVKYFVELDGSFRGKLDPDQAIEGLGYRVTSKTLAEDEIGFGTFEPIYEDKFKPGNLVRFTKVGTLHVRFDDPFEQEDYHNLSSFGINAIEFEDLFLLLKPLQIETKYNILVLELLHGEKTKTAYVSTRFSENIDDLLIKVK